MFTLCSLDILTGARLLALPPRFVPEWSMPLPGPPRFVRVVRWQPQNPAELLVGLESGELLLLSSDGTRRLADYQCREPAIDACPVQDRNGSALLAVALPRRVILLDRHLKKLKDVPVPTESRLSFLRAGDVTGDRAEEVVGVDARDAWILTSGGMVVRRLACQPVDRRSQSAPSQVCVADLDSDGRDEVVISDGCGLVVLGDTGHMLLARRIADTADVRSGARGCSLSGIQCFDVGDLDRDGHLELVARERVNGRLQITCWYVPDSVPRWSTVLADGCGLGRHSLLQIANSDVYCAVDSADGVWFLSRLDPNGRLNLKTRCETGGGVVTDIQNCRGDLVLTCRTPLGLQTVWSVSPPRDTEKLPGATSASPDRAFGNVQGLGYNGVLVREVRASRVDNDDRTDLLVIRSSPSGEHALDVFRNNDAALQIALDSARRDYQTALASGSRDAVRRAGRRLESMEKMVGSGARLEPQRRARFRSGLGLGLLRTALVLVILAFGYWFIGGVLRVRRARQTDAIVRPAPELFAIDSDTIALDHVFVSKGNTAGAIVRIDELRRRHGLMRDPDLMRIRTALEPYYSHYIYRLINRPKTIDFLSWVLETIRAMPVEKGLNVATLTREQLTQRLYAGDFQGRWLVKVQNWDAPDAIEQLRIYSDRALSRWLEHAIADNLRHAQSWSLIALEYTVNTTWNRKLTIHFLNDGPGLVDLSHSDTHLGAQFQELQRLGGDFLEFSRSPRELMEYEKYWVRFWDYLAILEDTHRRQTRGTTGEL
jgi:hypothetical protein